MELELKSSNNHHHGVRKRSSGQKTNGEGKGLKPRDLRKEERKLLSQRSAKRKKNVLEDQDEKALMEMALSPVWKARQRFQGSREFEELLKSSFPRVNLGRKT